MVQGPHLPQGHHAGRAARGPGPPPCADGPRGRRRAPRGDLGRGLRQGVRAPAPGGRRARDRRGDGVRRQPARARLRPVPVRRHPDRDVGHPDDLLPRRRRPVAQERRRAPDVRRHVVDPGPRRPAHRPLRGDGRQPLGVPGLAARLPGPDGRDRGDPQARRPGAGRRPAPDRHGREGRRVAADQPRHRRGAADGRGARAVRRRPGRPRDRRRARRRRGQPPRGQRRVDPGAGGRGDRHRRRPDPRPGPRARGHRARRRLRADRALQPGVRHPRELAGRRGQHPHPALRRPGRADVPARLGLVA